MTSRRHSATLFIIFFVIVGLVMKMVSEVIHEVIGHGTFIAIFGGSIQDVYISILWPYELSYITPLWPTTLTDSQLAFFYYGGIIFSLAVSFALQLLLFRKGGGNLWLQLSLFWLAFWCLLSATGYLVVGGLSPFGDMMWLISHRFINPIAAILVGTLVFLPCFFLLQPILRRNLAKVFTETKARLAVSAFWLSVPIVATLAILGRGTLPALVFLPISLIPLALSLVAGYWSPRKGE